MAKLILRQAARAWQENFHRLLNIERIIKYVHMRQGVDFLNSRGRRGIDIAIGSALMPAFVVASAPTAVASVVDVGRMNPFYKQPRIGVDGDISVWKIRTMWVPPEEEPFPSAGAYDTRASKWGRAIRSASLDETPQLINVFKGDMALAGPRPLTDKSLDAFHDADPETFESWWPVVKQVPPGLTGPGQIFRRRFRNISNESLGESMKLDLKWLENVTALTYLQLLALTIPKLIEARLKLSDDGNPGQPDPI